MMRTLGGREGMRCVHFMARRTRSRVSPHQLWQPHWSNGSLHGSLVRFARSSDGPHLKTSGDFSRSRQAPPTTPKLYSLRRSGMSSGSSATICDPICMPKAFASPRRVDKSGVGFGVWDGSSVSVAVGIAVGSVVVVGSEVAVAEGVVDGGKLVGAGFGLASQPVKPILKAVAPLILRNSRRDRD